MPQEPLFINRRTKDILLGRLGGEDIREWIESLPEREYQPHIVERLPGRPAIPAMKPRRCSRIGGKDREDFDYCYVGWLNKEEFEKFRAWAKENFSRHKLIRLRSCVVYCYLDDFEDVKLAKWFSAEFVDLFEFWTNPKGRRLMINPERHVYAIRTNEEHPLTLNHCDSIFTFPEHIR